MNGARVKVVGAAFISGALFALGLVVAGMTRPSKVLGFLDFFGAWDQSLMWVMSGAIGVNASLAWKILARKAPLFQPRFSTPPVVRTKWWNQVNVNLVLGAVLFGIGWGLSGYCPGPAIVSLPSAFDADGSPIALVFGASMVAGMLLFSAYSRYRTRTENLQVND